MNLCSTTASVVEVHERVNSSRWPEYTVKYPLRPTTTFSLNAIRISVWSKLTSVTPLAVTCGSSAGTGGATTSSSGTGSQLAEVHPKPTRLFHANSVMPISSSRVRSPDLFNATSKSSKLRLNAGMSVWASNVMDWYPTSSHADLASGDRAAHVASAPLDKPATAKSTHMRSQTGSSSVQACQSQVATPSSNPFGRLIPIRWNSTK
mmetsp:Transcript_36392/g.95590  ORF Transcript_36392/g.95590 Transcript_36392/m.95590 type:complete len:206 (+) Transcript_36392:1109-1726(+)